MMKIRRKQREIAKSFGRRGKEKTVDEALATVNPHYYRGEEYRKNCQRCVYAYEMARRGYDVEATEKIMRGRDETASHWSHIMEGQTWKKMPSRGTIDSILNEMESWGAGARGVIYVVWKGGRSAHVFNCEVDRATGVQLFMDAQTGKYVDLQNYLNGAIKGRTEISRIDNLEPSDRITGCARRRH